MWVMDPYSDCGSIALLSFFAQSFSFTPETVKLSAFSRFSKDLKVFEICAPALFSLKSRLIYECFGRELLSERNLFLILLLL